MPKISAAARLNRRNHVLVSAWKCFSREGFHATSMDDVIAETGMSSSSVYRYFRSKEELIDAAAEETLSQTYSAISELISDDAVPGPAETLESLMAALRGRQQGDYDLTKISMAAWAEGLRRPAVHDFAYDFYAKMNDLFTALTRRWISAGMLPKGTDTDALANFLVTLMPGMLVMSHLYELPDSETLATGIADFGKAASKPGKR
jgi:AcrR family transcriptional regulator